MSASVRRPEFDIARGFTIILVVLGHCSWLGAPPWLIQLIFSFHMPLFFIVSGYFLRTTQKLSVVFIKESAASILLPYFWACVAIIGLSVLHAAISPNLGVSDQFSWWFKASLYGSGGVLESMPDGIGQIGGLWFLWALFWGRILLTFCNKIKYPVIPVACLFAVGFLTKDLFWLPLGIQPSLCCVTFLYAGQLAQKYEVFEAGKFNVLVWIGMFAIWIICAVFGGALYMVSNTYENIFLNIAGGVCCSFVLIKVCQLVANKATGFKHHPFETMGANTLAIFSMHIVELDVMPWDTVLGYLGLLPMPVWFSAFIFQLVVTAIMCGVLYVLPRFISGCFYKSRKLA